MDGWIILPFKQAAILHLSACSFLKMHVTQYQSCTTSLQRTWKKKKKVMLSCWLHAGNEIYIRSVFIAISTAVKQNQHIKHHKSVWSRMTKTTRNNVQSILKSGNFAFGCLYDNDDDVKLTWQVNVTSQNKMCTNGRATIRSALCLREVLQDDASRAERDIRSVLARLLPV